MRSAVSKINNIEPTLSSLTEFVHFGRWFDLDEKYSEYVFAVDEAVQYKVWFGYVGTTRFNSEREVNCSLLANWFIFDNDMGLTLQRLIQKNV